MTLLRHFVQKERRWLLVSLPGLEGFALIYHRVRTEPLLETFWSDLPKLQIVAQSGSQNEKRVMRRECSSDVGVAMAEGAELGGKVID